MDPATILVVDDDPPLRGMFEEFLTALGYHVLPAASAEAALQILATVSPQLVLTDVHMAAMSGIELFQRIQKDPGSSSFPSSSSRLSPPRAPEAPARRA
jgi:two-component system phosphate regulon response regulator PhoB